MFWDSAVIWKENERGTMQFIVTLERGFRLGLFFGVSPWSAWFDVELVCVRVHLWWGFRPAEMNRIGQAGVAQIVEADQHVFGDNYEN